MHKTIGILTGGGDAPGLNAVIRAVVKTATCEYGQRVIGIEDGFEGLLGETKTRELTATEVRGLLPRGGTILGSRNRGKFAERTSAEVATGPDGAYKEASANLEKLGIEGLIVLGGEGTLEIAMEFDRLGFPVVGVPKTIDNDLACTELTFGFVTALDIATEALDRLHTTAESHDRVMILEVMGRHCGWIALHSGLAGGADIILIPEIPYTPEAIVESIRSRQKEGSPFDIIVVAEGAKRVGGAERYIDRRSKRLGGIAYQVADEIARAINLEIRVTVLGHIQRGGSPIPFDRVLATRFGKAAADLIAKGDFGKMVALRGEQIVAVPIRDAVSNPKYVDPDGELVATARSLGISFGDGR